MCFSVDPAPDTIPSDAAPAAEAYTEFSVVIRPDEVITARLTVRDGGVDSHLTNTKYPSVSLDRRFDGFDVDAARARILAEADYYRESTDALAQLEAMLSRVGVQVG